MTIRYNKLVRDRIPEIIESEGSECNVRVLDNAEFSRELDYKLAEELSEYQESKDLEELVDIVELIRAIVARNGVSWEDFEQMRASKCESRGGFSKMLFLESVIPNGLNDAKSPNAES